MALRCLSEATLIFVAFPNVDLQVAIGNASRMVVIPTLFGSEMMVPFDSLLGSARSLLLLCVEQNPLWTIKAINQLGNDAAVNFTLVVNTSAGDKPLTLVLVDIRALQFQRSRPFAAQRIGLAVRLECSLADVSVVVGSIVITPRAAPITEAISFSISSAQAIAVISGDSNALSVGRLTNLLTLLQCGTFFGSDWTGSGIIPLDFGNGVVNTISGNILFLITGVVGMVLCAAGAVVINFGLDSVATMIRSALTKAFRFPSIVFVFLSPTLATSLVAVVAHFQSPAVWSALPLLLSIVALIAWGGYVATVLLVSAKLAGGRLRLHQKHDSQSQATDPATVLQGCIGTVERFFRRRTKWTDEGKKGACHSFAPIFDDVTVVWYPSLDVGVASLSSILVALPLGGTTGCAVVACALLALNCMMLVVGIRGVFARNALHVSNIALQTCVVGSAIVVVGAVMSSSDETQGGESSWIVAAQFFAVAVSGISILRSGIDVVVVTMTLRHNINTWVQSIAALEEVEMSCGEEFAIQLSDDACDENAGCRECVDLVLPLTDPLDESQDLNLYFEPEEEPEPEEQQEQEEEEEEEQECLVDELLDLESLSPTERVDEATSRRGLQPSMMEDLLDAYGVS